MSKKFVVLALTGMLALAACSQGGVTTPTPTPNPSNPTPNPSNPTPNPSNPTPTPTPTPASAPVINVTSPAQNSVVTGNTVTVVGNVTSSAPLASLTLNNVSVPVNSGLNNNFNVAVPVDSTAFGAFAVKITATDTAGKTATYTLNLNANQASQTGVTVVGPNLGNSGRDAANAIAGQTDPTGGVRQLAQSNVDPSNPTSDVYNYVRGVITVTTTAPAGASRVEVYVAATPDGPAIDNLIDVSSPAAGALPAVQYDTRRRGNLEGLPLYLVTRINNTNISFLRIVADNSAPDPADIDFEAAQGVGNNALKNINPGGGPGTLNYARGAIRVITTNTDLRDKPNGTTTNPYADPNATGGSPSGLVNLLPSGFDSISYYLVPQPYVAGTGATAATSPTPAATTITNAIDNASTPAQKLRAVKGNATASQTVTASGGNSNFGAAFVSGAGGTVTDGGYRIYSVTRDQLGNEALNPQYETVIFDNIGPSIGSLALRDDSPLPFPSANPTRYISDYFTVGGTVNNGDQNGTGTLPDGTPAVGTNVGAQITLGSLNLTPGGRFDSNLLADGQYTVNVSNYTDILGNPPSQTGAAQTVTIDNTDPTVNFNAPDNGVTVVSGSEVSAQSTVSDLTSGVYRTFLFWNDATDIGGANTRLRSNGYNGAPVEFYTNQVYPVDATTAATYTPALGQPISNSATWNAVYPNFAAAGPLQMWLMGMAIDNAGNASIIRRELQVTPKSEAYSSPSLGTFDGYVKNLSNGTFGFNGESKPGAVAGAATGADGNNFMLRVDGTPTGFGVETTDLYATPIDPEQNAEIALRVSATAPAIANSAGGEKLRAVKMYGQFNSDLWRRIIAYQTTNPGTSAGANGLDADPTLARNPGLLNSRVFQWTNINDTTTATAVGGSNVTPAPWLSLGDTSTSSEFYSANTAMNSFLSDYIRLDAINSNGPVNADGTNVTGQFSTAYTTGPAARGTARPFYDGRNGAQLPYYKYDALGGVVTDTAGFRSSFGEAAQINGPVIRPGAAYEAPVNNLPVR